MRKIILFVLSLFICLGANAQSWSPVKDDKTGKWGYVNERGVLAINSVLDECYSRFWDGIVNQPVDFATVKYKGKWGCINKQGEFVVQPVFGQAHEAHRGGEAWQEKKSNGSSGITHLTPVKDNSTGKWGYYDDAGHNAIKSVFDECYSRFWDGVINQPVDFATVKYKGKWGCVNRQGEFVVQPVFGQAHEAHRGGEAWQNDFATQGAMVQKWLDNDKEDEGPVQIKSVTDGTTTTTTIIKENSTTYSTSIENKDGSTSDNMVVVYNAPVASPQGGMISPKMKIISPASGSGYNSTTIVIKYEVSTAGNIPYDVLISIDGERVDAASMKGVKRAFSEVTVTLPPKAGKACNVQLVAKDANGNSSEPVSIALTYTGNKPKPNLLVVAVGVSEYQKQGLRLKNAANDARDFVAAIQNGNNSLYGNVKVSSVLLDNEATYSNVRKAMSQIVREAAQDDVVMFFFSGHGSIEEKRTYFLPVDVDTEDLFATAVDFDDIIASAKRLKDKECKVVIIMDACHSGALLGMKSAFALEMSAPGISILSSSTGNQQSKEYAGWRNGVFTKYLLDGLHGDASDAEGNISIDNLGFYVRKKVSEKDASQSPLYQNEQRNFVLFEKLKK